MTCDDFPVLYAPLLFFVLMFPSLLIIITVIRLSSLSVSPCLLILISYIPSLRLRSLLPLICHSSSVLLIVSMDRKTLRPIILKMALLRMCVYTVYLAMARGLVLGRREYVLYMMYPFLPFPRPSFRSCTVCFRLPSLSIHVSSFLPFVFELSFPLSFALVPESKTHFVAFTRMLDVDASMPVRRLATDCAKTMPQPHT